MFNWLSGKLVGTVLKADIHSHLLPGLDDGVNEFDETLQILQSLQKLGYQKAITTPHIYSEVYPNQKSTILKRYQVACEKIAASDLSIKLEVAAEYFIDEHLFELIDSEELLSIEGKNETYVLVETGFYSKSMIFDEVMFRLQQKGYTPILAHPERYLFTEGHFDWFETLKSSGIRLQMNMGSLAGYYGKTIKKTAKGLMKRGMVDFIGSDIHKLRHLSIYDQITQRKIGKHSFLNQELI